jgi:hypothetical protein
MSSQKPKSRMEANKPSEVKHLSADQKQVLDLQAEAEHADGKVREKLTRKMRAK